jgi:hypothetical protein
MSRTMRQSDAEADALLGVEAFDLQVGSAVQPDLG